MIGQIIGYRYVKGFGKLGGERRFEQELFNGVLHWYRETILYRHDTMILTVKDRYGRRLEVDADKSLRAAGYDKFDLETAENIFRRLKDKPIVLYQLDGHGRKWYVYDIPNLTGKPAPETCPY